MDEARVREVLLTATTKPIRLSIAQNLAPEHPEFSGYRDRAEWVDLIVALMSDG